MSTTGIYTRYKDVFGKWHRTPETTRKAIWASMQKGPPVDGRPVSVVHPGGDLPVERNADLILEDGLIVKVNGTLPPDIPYGYHELRPRGRGRQVHLIVSPRSCFLPDGIRTWGWAVQLYAMRSRQSWGMGDLRDLQDFALWTRETHGAGIVLVNPLLAVNPVLPQEPSPYYPTSRLFRNPLYLRIEEIPGAEALPREVESLAEDGRSLNHVRTIDRDKVFRLKMKALEKIWTRFGTAPAFEKFLSEQGHSLLHYGSFCALAETFGGGWHSWPEEYRHPASPAVARFADEHIERVRFHQWLQWLVEEQLCQASRELPIMQDLPVGFDPEGYDAWAWQDVLAPEMSVGAPPDEFSSLGQDWGLVPFVPDKLSACAYLPFRETVRAILSHSGALRIDHVMGMFRLFWIPKGMSPALGAYVRYPFRDLLAVIAIESHRRGAFIVGEDLGTVQKTVRKELARHKVLSYRLLWFEEKLPGKYSEFSLASVTTHDLPTIAGLWSGSDFEVQKKLDLRPNEEGTREIRKRLENVIRTQKNSDIDWVITETHRMLASSPSCVVTATLEDALAVHERPNMPSALTQWPNWSLSLPIPLEEIRAFPLVNSVAQAISQGRKKG